MYFTQVTIPQEVLKRFTLPEGATLSLRIAPEEESPDGHFASGDDAQDAALVASINADRERNKWAWCFVTVTVTDGDASGSASLGCCNYSSGEDFMTPGDYFDDMVRVAIAEYATARQRLVEKYS